VKITLGRVLSLLIAIGYMVALIAKEGREIMVLCLVPLFPVALIWFPDEFGGYFLKTGDYNTINEPTPGIFVSIMGWFFLFGMPFFFYFCFLHK